MNWNVLNHRLTRRTGAVTKSNLNLVLADGYVGDIGKDARLARNSVRIHLQDLLEIFRLRRLLLGHFRHEAVP